MTGFRDSRVQGVQQKKSRIEGAKEKEFQGGKNRFHWNPGIPEPSNPFRCRYEDTYPL
jgi:hypothetical protein